mmetsp:Transcript_404/g.3072  ORF Transcript_404/g.3072 Transcript_404/m.3072 type:complete len:200 (-) Transcript_404:414-1013(-)
MFDEKDFVNPYDVLGLEPGASLPAIKKAFREKAREIHPDKVSSPDGKAKADEKFKELLQAYQSLQDDVQKKFWDEGGIGKARMADGPAMQARWAAARRMRENLRAKDTSASAEPAGPSNLDEGELDEILHRFRGQMNASTQEASQSAHKPVPRIPRWKFAAMIGSVGVAAAYYFWHSATLDARAPRRSVHTEGSEPPPR